MAHSIVGTPTPNPDGTSTVYVFDSDTGQTSTQVVGTPVDPIAAATQRGQSAAAQTQAQYSDPWYTQNFLDPMNAATAAQTADRATALTQAATKLAQEGRTVDANTAYQQGLIEARKTELRQQNQQFYSGQQLSANQTLAQLRGPGNYAQYLDMGRRMNGMGIGSGVLGDIAAGKMPQGAFVPGGGGGSITAADRMSGLLGAPSQSAIDQRDANDRAAARQFTANVGQAPRGVLESLAPVERDYLGSYIDATGANASDVFDAYKRAGIQQGRTIS